jgi:hypothetical protein
MNEHPVPWIVCIMCGVFGATFLVAFLAQFDSTVISAGKIDDAPPQEKTKRWLDTLLSMSGRYVPPLTARDYGNVWRGTKGQRFLVPLGLGLCAISWLVHHYWIARL